MTPEDERDREIANLRERLSRLSEASLRITEDVDLDNVLREVLDGARFLTGARRGCMTTLDDAGQPEEFKSSGFTEEDHQQCLDLPGGLEFFTYLSKLPGPLRVTDFSSHVAAVGLPEVGPPLGPVTNFLSAPIRHAGRYMGNVYLSDKEGGLEFSDEDEETLTMFASQGAMAIANARRHRDERRARADLETLVDTSPVGVVVFDAGTGAPVSSNREARRIVEYLRNPDQAPEMLLDILTFTRADGREISLRKFPMPDLLRTGETLRGEEIVLRAPDGRTVTVLLNATPIFSEEGVVESMVVTMQDMADIKELERMRAEFLAMVSHELRVPLTSIKGSASTVLDSAADLDPAVVRQFFRIIADQADNMHDLVTDLLDVARIDTGTLAVSPEPAEIVALVDRARTAFLGASGRNNLSVEIGPDLPLVMADKRRIVQVLGNLLSNAARHSPESSVIKVTAVREDVCVAVSVSGEGRGIPAERLPRLFRKFSKEQSEDQGGDTGLGLAICKGIVEAHGGRIWAESDGPGLGARFTFTLPTIEESAGRGPSAPPRASSRASARRHRDLSEPVRVLAVDDDPNDLRYIRDTLVQFGYAPTVTGNPWDAPHLIETDRPELVLLDLLLPGTDGIKLMEEIHESADVPVIFLSAYGQEELIARAFDMGAADYLVKPFSPTELAARIRAALRRRTTPEPSEPYVLKGLTIDYARRRVTLEGSLVPLVSMEYRLLAELSAYSGQVLTYEHLLTRVWGEGGDGEGDLRPMRTMMSKLRRKLGDDADNPTYIFTEHRVGYRMPKSEAGSDEPPETP